MNCAQPLTTRRGRMPDMSSGKKNLRRVSVLVTAQTAHNIRRLAAMENTNEGRVIDKLVRDRMLQIRDLERLVTHHG